MGIPSLTCSLSILDMERDTDTETESRDQETQLSKDSLLDVVESVTSTSLAEDQFQRTAREEDTTESLSLEKARSHPCMRSARDRAMLKVSTTTIRLLTSVLTTRSDPSMPSNLSIREALLQGDQLREDHKREDHQEDHPRDQANHMEDPDLTESHNRATKELDRSQREPLMMTMHQCAEEVTMDTEEGAICCTDLSAPIFAYLSLRSQDLYC